MSPRRRHIRPYLPAAPPPPGERSNHQERGCIGKAGDASETNATVVVTITADRAGQITTRTNTEVKRG